MVANFGAKRAAINVLAGVASASIRWSTSRWTPTGFGRGRRTQRVRRGSGDISVEDALSQDEDRRGRRSRSAPSPTRKVDGGSRSLIAGDMGIGNTTPATVLVSALTNTEPVAVVGRGTGIDFDAGWMRKPRPSATRCTGRTRCRL